jgi:hypothetical protein
MDANATLSRCHRNIGDLDFPLLRFRLRRYYEPAEMTIAFDFVRPRLSKYGPCDAPQTTVSLARTPGFSWPRLARKTAEPPIGCSRRPKPLGRPETSEFRCPGYTQVIHRKAAFRCLSNSPVIGGNGRFRTAIVLDYRRCQQDSPWCRTGRLRAAASAATARDWI